MGSITNIDFALRWGKPVYVGESDTLDTAIAGPADAIRWMQTHFRSRNGFLYRRAHSLCHDALLGQVHPDFARQPFVDAWVRHSLSDTEE